MAKKNALVKVESDGSEKLLEEMIERFSTKRAIDWLRVKFPSFDTGRTEAIACDATKNEKDYFAAAELLGYVTRMPQGKTDDTNRPLLVAAVKMKKDMAERTSRLVQFNFAKKILQSAVMGGARGLNGLPSQGLFFFYDKDGYFRLSLVSGEVEKRRFKFNEAKRQSFYVEPCAANNIVKRRLTPAVRAFDELKDVFSVEQLTKEFYTRLFDWYTWAMSPQVNVHFPNDLDDKTDDRKYNNEALIRMITRLMFTWFIRQRKLVPDEIFDREALDGILKKFEPDSMEQDNYYRAILQNLFFATFNCPQTGKGKLKRRWIDADVGADGDGVWLSDDYGVKTVYRYKDQFKNADAFLEMMKRVPFLNCALFDCLDKVERKEDGGRKLYFDGFSTKKKRQAYVPNGLFFDKERGIISLFNRYEFTVNENNADDSDVALDPELLGKVFENLLGAYNPETRETARNATGSFYTPREIVDYMVEESLKNYLKTKVPAADDKRLEDLFDRSKAAEGAETQFSCKEKDALLNALYDCKILDPACGSGAFPMGVLHCMVRLLTRLDPQSLSIRQHLLDRYRVDKAVVDSTESAADREERLAELEIRLREGQHYPDYERKLYLIENCIYGVDIQPIATQISKLRFFISLLCDQLRTSYDPDAENFGLLSLPNLEAKFVCANTLISLPEVGALDASVGNIAELRRELQSNRHKIFCARSTRTKEKYKNKDLEIRDAIRATVKDSLSKPDEDVIAKCREQIADAQKRRIKVAEPDWVEEEVAVQADLFSTFEKKIVRKDRNAPARDKIDAEISWAEETIKKELSKADRSNVSAATRYADMVAGWDPYDQNASSPFFDPEWMFNNTTGFDVVIGNPPYIQLQANGGELAKVYQDKGFKTFDRTGDLYCLFYECGWQLLADCGTLSYITSDKWMRNDYGRSFRKFLREKTNCKLLVDFTGQQLFNSATVEANVLQFTKEAVTSCAPLACSIRETPTSNLGVEVARIASPCEFDSDDGWAIVSNAESLLRKKIESAGVKLMEWAGISLNRGLVTGANNVFVVSSDLKNRLIREDKTARKLFRPVLRGRDVQRYSEEFADLWLIATYPACEIDIDKFPSVKEYLLSFGKSVLAQTGEKNIGGIKGKNARKKTCNKWFETQDQVAFWREMESEKVVWGELSDEAKFTLSSNTLLNTCVFMSGGNSRYFLGVLNSKLASWYFQFICTKSGMGTVRWYKGTVEQLPVVRPDAKSEAAISDLVDQILASKAKDREADTSPLEAKIDQLVYKLYGLTEEEIAVVEGAGEKKPTAPKSERNARSRRSEALPVADDEDDEKLE